MKNTKVYQLMKKDMLIGKVLLIDSKYIVMKKQKIMNKQEILMKLFHHYSYSQIWIVMELMNYQFLNRISFIYLNNNCKNEKEAKTKGLLKISQEKRDFLF